MHLFHALALALLAFKHSSAAATQNPLLPREAFAKNLSPPRSTSPEPFWPEEVEPHRLVPAHPESPIPGERFIVPPFRGLLPSWRPISHGVGGAPLHNSPDTDLNPVNVLAPPNQPSQSSQTGQSDSLSPTPAAGQLYAPYEGVPFLTYPRPGAGPRPPPIGPRPAHLPLPPPIRQVPAHLQTSNDANPISIPPAVIESSPRPRPPPHYSAPPIWNPSFRNPPPDDTPASQNQRGRSRERNIRSPPSRRSQNPSPPPTNSVLQRRSPSGNNDRITRAHLIPSAPNPPQPDLLTLRPPSPRFTSLRHGMDRNAPLLPALPLSIIPPSVPAARAHQQPTTPLADLPLIDLLSLPPPSLQFPSYRPELGRNKGFLPLSQLPSPFEQAPPSSAQQHSATPPPPTPLPQQPPSIQIVKSLHRPPNPPPPHLLNLRPSSPRFTSFREDVEAFPALRPPVPHLSSPVQASGIGQPLRPETPPNPIMRHQRRQVSTSLSNHRVYADAPASESNRHAVSITPGARRAYPGADANHFPPHQPRLNPSARPSTRRPLAKNRKRPPRYTLRCAYLERFWLPPVAEWCLDNMKCRGEEVRQARRIRGVRQLRLRELCAGTCECEREEGVGVRVRVPTGWRGPGGGG